MKAKVHSLCCVAGGESEEETEKHTELLTVLVLFTEPSIYERAEQANPGLIGPPKKEPEPSGKIQAEVVAGQLVEIPFDSELERKNFERINLSTRFERPSANYYRWHLSMSQDVLRIQSDIHGQLYVWNVQPVAAGGNRRGFLVEPGAQYIINVGGNFLDSDGSWMTYQRDASLTNQAKRHRCTRVPNFVVEVRSRGETRANQKEKMVRWIEAGVQSGFLVDPICRRTYVYVRAGAGLLPAGAAVAGHPGVEKQRYLWGPNTAAGQGPALVVPGVGHLAGFNLDHQTFPTL